MRIDIHPDFLSESLARKKQESTVYGTEATTFVEKSWDLDRAAEYEKLLQSIYDGVLITDLKGRIVDFNSRAVDFFFCSDAELYGARVIDLISGADEQLLTAIRRNLQNHRHTLIEAHCVRRDKSMFPAEIAVNKIQLDGNGQLCFFIRDITIRKKEQAALEEAIAKLEEHDRARSLFVSNVSHELRTPLTSMIYAVKNMLKGVCGSIPERARRYLEILDGDCKRLLGTVNDILDLRKVENKTLTLARARVPIARLIRRSVGSLAVQAEQKSLNLTVSCDKGMWFAYCDAQKMERVVLNVVGNAVKFTPDGGRIEVRVEDDPTKWGYVRFITIDNGIGIPAEALPRVTERYFTVGEQPSGCGLGLALSKEIVEVHGGSVEIKSPPPDRSRGTSVAISLPIVESPTLLVVDDDKAVLALLAEQIAEQGYHVITAENGIEALEKVRSQHPDMVILDLVLPGMEGTEVILQMRGDKDLMRIPVIVITGANVGGAKAEILSSFSIPALSKPWQESELLDRVEGAFLGATAFSR
jgi:PAS domain S-box-containing protein